MKSIASESFEFFFEKLKDTKTVEVAQEEVYFSISSIHFITFRPTKFIRILKQILNIYIHYDDTLDTMTHKQTIHKLLREIHQIASGYFKVEPTKKEQM